MGGYVVAFAVLGCSAKNRIDDAAINVSGLAESSAARFDHIGQLARSSEARFADVDNLEGVTEQQQIIDQAEGGRGDQQEILVAASGIRSDLHGVKDIVPWWASLIGQIAIAAAIIALLILLWKSGALLFIQRIFWSLGILIPKKQRAEALMDLKALADDDEITLSETVAAKRARDPAYCAAFKKAKRMT